MAYKHYSAFGFRVDSVWQSSAALYLEKEADARRAVYFGLLVELNDI